jgi:hypothetical protein
VRTNLRTCALLLVIGTAAVLGFLSGLQAGEPALADLRRRVLEARDAQQIGAALDALQLRIGKDDALPDAGALGDWLGELPDGRNKHPLVLIRRGWAYVTVRRGKEALPLLEAALKDDPSRGYVRSYLGQAQYQTGEAARALETLATAVKAGYDAPHLRETALQAVLWLRKERPVKDAEGLPEYVKAASAYLLGVADDVLMATLARALLDDLAAYEKPSTERGQAWAQHAGEFAQAVLSRNRAVEGGARLALDAAAALEVLDREEQGRTPRFDLLASAYALGKPADREGHDLPEVLPLLAEAALAEGRFDLAHRLARERLAISESPAARRVLLALPPDVGD